MIGRRKSRLKSLNAMDLFAAAMKAFEEGRRAYRNALRELGKRAD